MFNISNFKLLKDLYVGIDRNDIVENLDDLLNIVDNSGLSKPEWDVSHRTDLDPMNVILSVSSTRRSILEYQLGSIINYVPILEKDYFVFVCENHLKTMCKEIVEGCISRNNNRRFGYKIIGIDRKVLGDTPVLNWAVGLNALKDLQRPTLFLRDNLLFFDPVELFYTARHHTRATDITNFSTILGHHLSVGTYDWVWATHSKWAPTPVLCAWVASGKQVKDVGFDIQFKQGTGYLGDLDFLLRWCKSGLNYIINDSVQVLRLPTLFTSEEEKKQSDIQSSVSLAYLKDKYGRDLRKELQPPFKIDLTLMTIQDAMTYDPFSVIKWDDYRENMIDFTVQESFLSPDFYVTGELN